MTRRILTGGPRFIFDDAVGRLVGFKQPNGKSEFLPLSPLPIAEGVGLWRVIGASAVAVTLTGSTDEAALAAFTLPGGALGPNGALRITTVYSFTNSANSKTMRYRLGGLGGTAIMAVSATTTVSNMVQRTIQNRGVQDSQVAAPTGNNGSFGNSGNSPGTAALDTAQDQVIALTGQLASSGETITLESWLAEACYMP